MNNVFIGGISKEKIYKVGLKSTGVMQDIKAENKKDAIKIFQMILRPVYGSMPANRIIAKLKK